MVKPHKEYYELVQPFQKDISDLALHFERREALYRQLGLASKLLAHQSIIEFGPGHGENALFTLRQGPARYILVDAIKSCLDHAKGLLEPNCPPQTQLEWHQADIWHFPQTEQFDLVICEGTIPLQEDPLRMLRQVASFTKPAGGMFLLTCTCAVSVFAEVLRRLIAAVVTDPNDNLETKADRITPFLSPHLATLKGMARPHRSWVLDNMIQPLTGEHVSIGDAVRELEDFDLFGTAPRFLVDYRWFREVHGDAKRYKEWAREQWLANLFNLLDYRVTLPPCTPDLGNALSEACDLVFQTVKRYDRDRDGATLSTALDQISQVARLVEKHSPKTAASIADYLTVFSRYMAVGNVAELMEFSEFTTHFGRGQQYVLFIRN